MDLNKSSAQIIIDLINEANPNSGFTEEDLEFGVPHEIPHSQSAQEADTAIPTKILASGKELELFVKRRQLSEFYPKTIEIPYAQEITELQVIQRTNGLGTQPLRLGDDDIYNPGFAVPTEFPLELHIRAHADSLYYAGGFRVRLTDPNEGGEVIDPNAPPVITISGGLGVQEGGDLEFILQANKPMVEDLQIDLIYGGTASGRGPLSVVMSKGHASAGLVVPTIDDGKAAGTRELSVGLVVREGQYTLGDKKIAKGKVTDSGYVAPLPKPVISIADAVDTLEGTVMEFVISLDIPAPKNLSLPLSYAGDATYGEDYTGPTALTVPEGATSVKLQLQIIDDGLPEPNEHVQVTIGESADYVLGDAVAAGTIIDTGYPDVVVSVSSAGNINEGGKAVFNLALSIPAPQDLTIPLTWGGTFTGQYAKPATVQIAKGQTSGKIETQTVDDTTKGLAGTIVVTLGAAEGVDLDTKTATVNVAATYASVGLSVNDPASVEEGGSVKFRVTLDKAAQRALSVPLSYGGTFTGTKTGPAKLDIPSGAAGPFDVEVLTEVDDNLDGGTITMTLGAGTGFTLTKATGTVTITDTSGPVDPEPGDGG